MLQEIREQPAAFARMLAEEAGRVDKLAAAARSRGVRMLFLAARGTSDHAAVYLKYLCEIVAGLPAALAAPSVFTLYEGRLHLDHALVLGISQSGKAADVIEVLRRSRDDGQLTGCITNDPGSPMAAAVEHPLCCRAGVERSLPATKTYTTSLGLTALLVAALAEDAALHEALQRIPGWIAEVLDSAAGIAGRTERYRYVEECVVLARGINQCTALETGLKLSETSYLRAHPFSGADFMHGPIAVVDEGYPCLVFAPSGRAHAMMHELVEALCARGAETVIFSDVDETLALATTPFRLPTVPELVSPIVGIVAAQLFAFHLARIKGRDPDHPRGLLKVTHTL